MRNSNLSTIVGARLPALRTGASWNRRGVLVAIAVVYFVAAAAVYLGAELGRFSPSLSPLGETAALAVGIFFLPSLVEELFWRWLLIPPARLGRLDGSAWRSIGVSTALFTAAHPLAAWHFVPHAQPLFWRAEFLLIVFALGVACGVSYVISKSIWPPVLLHWVTVVAWKFLFGGPFIMLGR